VPLYLTAPPGAAAWPRHPRAGTGERPRPGRPQHPWL